MENKDPNMKKTSRDSTPLKEIIKKAGERFDEPNELQKIPVILSEIGPLFEAIFQGIEYPIKDKADLIKKAGGEDRILTIPDPSDRFEYAYSLLDVFEAYPEFTSRFPIVSIDEVRQALSKSEGQEPPKIKIKPTHLMEILTKPRTLRHEPVDVVFPSFEEFTKTNIKRSIVDTLEQSMTLYDGSAPGNTSFNESASAIIQIFKDVYIKDLFSAILAAVDLVHQYDFAAEIAAKEAWSALQIVANPKNHFEASVVILDVRAAARKASKAAQDADAAVADARHYFHELPGSTPLDIQHQAHEALIRAYNDQVDAGNWATEAQGYYDTAKKINSIQAVDICGGLRAENFDPDGNPEVFSVVCGAFIMVFQTKFSDIMPQISYTDPIGQFKVFGRFGPSNDFGPLKITIVVNALPAGYNYCESFPTTYPDGFFFYPEGYGYQFDITIPFGRKIYG